MLAIASYLTECSVCVSNVPMLDYMGSSKPQCKKMKKGDLKIGNGKQMSEITMCDHP